MLDYHRLDKRLDKAVAKIKAGLKDLSDILIEWGKDGEKIADEEIVFLDYVAQLEEDNRCYRAKLGIRK